MLCGYVDLRAATRNTHTHPGVLSNAALDAGRREQSVGRWYLVARTLASSKRKSMCKSVRPSGLGYRPKTEAYRTGREAEWDGQALPAGSRCQTY